MRISKRQWVFALSVGVVAMLLLGCSLGLGGNGKESGEAPQPGAESTEGPVVVEDEEKVETPAEATEAPAEEAPAPAGDPKSIIAASSAKLNSLESHRMKVIVETGGQTMETTFEYMMPDRFHMISDFAEVIKIEDKTYIKAGDTWTELPGEVPSTDMADIGIDESDITEAVQEGGVEDVDGVSCYKYVYTAQLEGQSPYHATTWIGVEDNLPRKLIYEQEGTKVTVTFYDFNAPDISIENPLE